MATYAQEVLADSPFRYYRMGEASGTLADTSGNSGPAITLAGGATYDATNDQLVTDDGAISFDGINDYGSVTLDLSGTSVVTIEFWLKWDVNGSDDDFAMEHGPNANSNNGFNIDPNNSTGGAEANTVSLKTHNGTDSSRWTIARPSAANWHHYAVVFNRSAAATCTAYVDGSATTATQRETNNTSGAFPNATLYLMSRSGTSLFGAGDLDELAIYTSALSSGRVAAHYAARSNTPGGGQGGPYQFDWTMP